MTAAKIEPKLSSSAQAGLEPWVQPLYASPGKRVIGIVELRHAERTQPAPDEDKEPKVSLRVTHLEVARPEQEEPVREALRALYLHRTASGTLDEDGELQLSREALRLTAGTLHALEAARLRAGLEHWKAKARQVLSLSGITETELRRELRVIAEGLAAVLHTPEGQE